jgi:hypothetical protein
MKESVRANAADAAHGVGGVRERRFAHFALAALLQLGLGASRSQAQPAAAPVIVVEASDADHAAADKLTELIKEPLMRVRAQPNASQADSVRLCCSGPAKHGLVLDTARHVVQLVRCSDASVLTREFDAEAARAAPYFGAFVGAELLGLAAELDRLERQPSAGPAPAAPRAVSTRLRLRLGAEFSAVGSPYAGNFRPSFGLGVSSALFPAPLSLFVEFALAPFGSAELPLPGGTLSFTRDDARLRLGILSSLSGFDLLAFAQTFGAQTSADYAAPRAMRSTQLRWGFGAGIEGEIALALQLHLYVMLTFDVAVSRSEYRVDAVVRVRDPAELLTLSFGLTFTPGL